MASQLGEAPKIIEKEEMEQPNQEENTISPSDYSCQILLEKTTLEVANDKSFPTDARLVWYVVDGVECIDLTRCGNPKLWGYKTKKEPKRKGKMKNLLEIR